MINDFQIELRSEPRLLHSIRGLVWRYVHGAGFSDDRTDEVVLAVDEACTNSMRHAYRHRVDRTVWLRLSSSEHALEIEVRDDGEPAPAECLQRKELLPPDPDDLRPGGLGVQLIYRVFDEVEFSPGSERGNRVRMWLKRPEPV